MAIVEERVADAFERELGRNGAHVLTEEEAQRARETFYPDGRIDTKLAGKDAAALADGRGDQGARRRRACSSRRSR